MTIHIHAFYRFFPFPGHLSARDPLRALMANHGLRGTILLAPEGINATIAGSAEGLAAVQAFLAAIPGLQGLEPKVSHSQTMPFARAKVKIKKEIVTLGRPAAPHRQMGECVPPSQWDALLAEPDIFVLDARNTYEIERGTFPGAVDPGTESFRELADYVERNLSPATHPKIATFCTGGIRCEKLTAFLKEKGFPEVYQLEGGILKYLETVPEGASRWQGECFVFDEREGVVSGVAPAPR